MLFSKKCSKCLMVKDAGDFKWAPAMRNSDKLSSQCLDCIKAYGRTDKGREAESRRRRRYAATESGRLKINELARKRSASDAGRAYSKKQYDKNRTKCIARALAAHRFPDEQPCSVCGSQQYIHRHHHNGYENPYDITWLCRKHHAETHATISMGGHFD